MIRDIDELEDGAVLRAEVGIVGAGFAGIDLARSLGRHGVKVVLLEGGGVDFDPAAQALTRVRSVGKPLRTPDPDSRFTPYLAPIFRGESRIRQLGGTSNIWTGKWRMLDALNFEPRPWIPASGWPIGMEDLRPFYAEIARDYELGDFDRFTLEAADGIRDLGAPEGLSASALYWHEAPLRLRRFIPELRESTSIDLVLGASATEIELEDDLRRARAIAFASLDGRRCTLSARHFVLATGGLEAPRLLLASNRQLPAGIGNAHDLVGRFYMDHPKHKRATLRPGPSMKRVAGRVAANPRPRFQLSFSLSFDAQRHESLLNHAITLRPVYRYTLDHPTSAVDEIKAGLRSRDARRSIRAGLALASSPRALWKVLQRQVHRDLGGPVAHYATTMYLEQAPNRASRVYLGTERDALGVLVLVVDWQLSALDHEAFSKLLRRLPDVFASAGLGHLDFGEEPLTLEDTVDAAHHIGATRMAATPAEGVVDRDCKVFGVDNLFIASSSVFPTGDSATPTFTILALARRLGAHLLDLRARGWGPVQAEALDVERGATS